MAEDELNELEMKILRAIPHVRDITEVAKAVHSSPAIVGREIARLQLGGYLGAEGELKEKGMKFVQE